MKQGVIRATQGQVSFFFSEEAIVLLGKKRKKVSKFNILTASTMVNKTLNSIPDCIFLNCFNKSGISEESSKKALQ